MYPRTSVWQYMVKPRRRETAVVHRGKRISIASYPQRGNIPVRTSEERDGADSSQISCPGEQARPLIIYDECGKKEMQLRVRTCVTQYVVKPSRWAFISPKRVPRLGHSLPTAVLRASKGKYGDAWCRIVANLFSGKPSKPSHNRCFENSLYQQQRRTWQEGNHYFV